MLELIHADSEQLLAGVHSTAQLAERISGKVRRLDTAQTRVQETLGRINLILDRTSCINGVQTAMDQEDWESAANYISTFTELESKLSGSENVAETGQAEEQQQVGCAVGEQCSRWWCRWLRVGLASSSMHLCASMPMHAAGREQQQMPGLAGCAVQAHHALGTQHVVCQLQVHARSAQLSADATSCIAAVQPAAAKHHRCPAMLCNRRHSATQHTVPTCPSHAAPTTAPQLLLSAKERLEQIVQTRFDDAVARRDQSSALRFAKLFAPLGRRREGLQKFVDYVQVGGWWGC